MRKPTTKCLKTTHYIESNLSLISGIISRKFLNTITWINKIQNNIGRGFKELILL